MRLSRDRSEEVDFCEECDLPIELCECRDDDDDLFDADELGLDPEDDDERRH